MPPCLEKRSNLFTKLAHLTPRLWVQQWTYVCANYGSDKCPEAAPYSIWGDGDAYLDVVPHVRSCEGTEEQVKEKYREALNEVKWLNPFTAYLKKIAECRDFHGLTQCRIEIGIPLLSKVPKNPNLLIYDIKVDGIATDDLIDVLAKGEFDIDWKEKKIVLESGTISFETAQTWRASALAVAAFVVGVI